MHSFGGFLGTNQKGRFGDFTVWYNPKSLANILSLSLVTEKYCVTLDNETENATILHISSQHKIKSICGENGLYYFDTSNVDLSKLKHAFIFLTTVEANKALFSRRDVRKAEDALSLNRKINHPAEDKFERVVVNKIRNNPVVIGDVKRSQAIFGPPIPPIKARTRYQTPRRIQDASMVVEIPKSIYENLKNVTLCVDFHYVNGVTIFHLISCNIKYRTVSFPLSRSGPSMMK